MQLPSKLLTSIGLVIALAGCNSDDRRVIVDDDRMQCADATHTTIQAAISDAGPGETITVCPGLYTGLVVIPATLTGLTLMGGDGLAVNRSGDPRVEAIIDGGAAEDTGLVVQASEVTIQGFTVRNTADTAIQVLSETGVTLSGIVIAGNALMNIGDPDDATVTCVSGRGINIEGATGVSVENNTVVSSCDAGIRLSPVNASTVRNNSITGSRKRPGIAVRDGSSGNLITGNNSQNNREAGISLQDSTGNTVTANMMRNNGVPGAPLRSIPGPGSNTDADDTTNLPLTNLPGNTWQNNNCLTENRQGLC